MFLISGASASDLSIGTGELLSLSSTFVFVFYLLYTDYATVQIDSSVHMMVVQLGTVSAYSLIVALLYEQHDWEWHHLLPFFPWLMYMAATEGVGFLLMAMGQLYSPPTHVAIILSLEGVFAAVGSALVLHEELTAWEIVGCALILTATLVAKIGEEMPCYDSCADNSYMVLVCGRCQCDKCRSSSDDRKHKGAGNSVSCGLLCSVYAVLKDCCWRQHHAFSNVNHILKPFVRLFGGSVSSGGGGSGPSNSSSSKPNSSGADLGVLLLSASSTVGNGQVHRTAISGGGGGGGGGGNGTITV